MVRATAITPEPIANFPAVDARGNENTHLRMCQGSYQRPTCWVTEPSAGDATVPKARVFRKTRPVRCPVSVC